MSRYLAISTIIGLAGAPRPVAAGEGGEPARQARPGGSVLVGLTIPDGLYVTGHDETIPLPAIRLSWQVVPRVSLDVGRALVAAGGVRRHSSRTPRGALVAGEMALGPTCGAGRV